MERLAVSTARRATLATLGLFTGLLLTACQNHRPPTAPPTPTVLVFPKAEPAPVVVAPADNLDEYKVQVATQILAANAPITFSGRLQPLLPAIVVVDISINRDGELANVEVKRSRDHEASRIALAAVRKVDKPFPKPAKLMHWGHKTLDFSETFLFNNQYHFQLRSLAGPQS
jgi:periplasmic protein TonB